MEILKDKNVNVKQVKQAFSKNFPNSPILKVILSLPDELKGEELIGATAVILDFLDAERNNNLKGGK